MQINNQGCPCIVHASQGEKIPKCSVEVPALYIKPHTEIPHV